MGSRRLLREYRVRYSVPGLPDAGATEHAGAEYAGAEHAGAEYAGAEHAGADHAICRVLRDRKFRLSGIPNAVGL